MTAVCYNSRVILGHQAATMTPKKNSTVVSVLPGAGGLKTAQASKAVKVKTNSVAASETPLRPAEIQLKTWDAAVRLFSQRRYGEAAPLFREAAGGPAVHVADKARSYEQICERQSAKPQEFRTAVD